MAVLVSFKQFGGRPLECWVCIDIISNLISFRFLLNLQLAGRHILKCFAGQKIHVRNNLINLSQNLDFIPFDEEIPVEPVERDYKQISYYQWVGFFLLIQAFLFYIPCMVWRLMSDKSG